MLQGDPGSGPTYPDASGNAKQSNNVTEVRGLRELHKLRQRPDLLLHITLISSTGEMQDNLGLKHRLQTQEIWV